MSGERKSAERGAALVIVLLLVATLSFIALAISERTALSANRAVNARSRSELLWLGLGAEALARLVNGGAHLRRVGDVGFKGEDLAAQSFDLATKITADHRQLIATQMRSVFVKDRGPTTTFDESLKHPIDIRARHPAR